MIQLLEGGTYLVNGTELVEPAKAAAQGLPAPEEAAKQTMAYNILRDHNTSGNMEKLQIKFDKLTSHDITFVGIIQTARASGLEKFPVPYVLTNCHNSLCAVGGTINEDDHMFGLTCAKKYGGVYVPPHQAVIHQFAREMLAGGGKMILGSDSHTRYGALGTMAMGEGGPELVKQLLNLTALEFGNDTPVMETFNLTDMIRGIITSSSILIQQKEAQVIFEHQDPLPVVADEFKIEEVITNYLTNALNHANGEKKIEIRAEELETQVKVTVFNTGDPIPEEDIPKLWTKFYKVDKARTRAYGGSGIGLSIVKAIMDSLHRECGVRNYENGVEFWFELDAKVQA